jgi:tRNA1(Val) A37 N6-methylase TrmN6
MFSGPASGARPGSPTKDQHRARAHVLAPTEGGAKLEAWIRASLAILAPGGRFVMIHRPGALASILAATERRLGALSLLPVHPSVGAGAHRLMISGVKGSKAPLRIAPALILHQADGRLTAEADTIHRGEAPMDWGR